MKKKKQGKRRSELIYETDKLYRWNLCQKLAKVVNDSELEVKEIIDSIENVEEYNLLKRK